ncbi:O-antigen ligase family protein [Dyella lutea]|uniref:O-antigen ligase family protein n=1 Tax=Dyella lutea TaxID=2950441 RepID=A0ABT1F5J4_9GAMM|nr:O-antigen ligase family protein [Dyella lutea]MCP1372610.1 O-antigen ligase family protein [Dyella lutea]
MMTAVRTEPPSRSGNGRHRILLAARWCAVASLFMAPVNKPGTNVALGLCILLSLLGADTGRRWLASWRHPVVRGALVWWGVLFLSALHTWYLTSKLPLGGSFVWACWYPLALGSVLDDHRWRRRALVAFAAAMALTVLISWGMAFGWIPQRALVATQPFMRNTVFKEYTQQGLATLIFASMALAAATRAQSRTTRWGLALVSVLAVANVCFALESRTSYLTLLPVAAYWAWRLLLRRWSPLKAGAAMLTLGAATATALWFIPLVRDRLVLSVDHEIVAYEQQHTATSSGIRLELWRRTLPMIASAPILGHGLHQWEPLYRDATRDMPNRQAFMMGHPHQEMLLIVAEQGCAGLLVYLLLLVALARYISRLDPPQRDIYASALLVYFVAGMANCLWADFTHRHVFILLLSCIPLVAQGESTKAPDGLPDARKNLRQRDGGLRHVPEPGAG